MLRRTFALAAAALGAALATGSHAQTPPRSYAVVSEFAREINVVIFQESTGTMLGNNLRDRIPVANGAFDKLVLVQAKQMIEKGQPGAKPWLVAPLDTDLFDARTVFVEGGTVAFPADLAAALKERGSTHLLAFTKLRAAASMKAENGQYGTGQVEGIGFYVDRLQQTKNTKTLVDSVGFVAPYTYFRASLIEVATGKVLRMRRTTEGEVLVAERADQARDPWAAMSANDKVRVLGDMLKREVDTALKDMLAP
jgi:hypothetical protein